MAQTTVPYVVRTGDHLQSIAAAHGLDPDELWQVEANAALRQQRPNPELLAPGDVVFIPVDERTWLPVTVGATNVFTGAVPTVRVDLRISQDDSGTNALVGLAYTIHGLPGGDLQGTVPSDGAISFDVPVGSPPATLELCDLQVTYPVIVGGMDPIETSSGVRYRLAHLGYLDDHQGGYSLETALAAFQRDHDINVTGTLDSATSAALTKAHGS